MRFLVPLIALLIATVGMAGQTSIDKKKSELQRLRSSIQSTQKKIDRLGRKETTEKRSLNSYQKQQHSVTVFIKGLETELQLLKDSAQTLQVQIRRTRSALSDAESAFNHTSKDLLLYKTKRKGMPESSVSTDAIYRVLSKSLSRYRQRMLHLRDSLEAEESLLTDYSITQDSVLSVKTSEERRLRSTIAKSSNQLKKIRNDKNKLNAQLKKRQQSVAKLKKIISDLVAKARKQAEEKQRREALARKKSGEAAPAPASTSVKGFSNNSLPWPTSSHQILNKYGSYKNPLTGTVLDNPGIDIKAKIGSTVKSVASGEVSSVTFLPGYNTIVIVDHGNGVRSVYGNLSTVNVRVGSKVASGSKIGSSGENIDGELVHFEIWNGRNRRNPLTYLR